MRIRLITILAVIGLLAGSCSGVRPEPLAFVDQDARPGQSVLRVATWDDTAISPGIEAWEREHPTARVVIDVLDPETHHESILDGTAVPADIVAIDSRYAEDFRNRTGLFVDLAPVVAAIDPGLGWRTTQGVSDVGTATSVAVDTGGLALAVRSDLLAGVADEESEDGGTLLDAVAAAETWCDLIAIGDAYADATGDAFLPSAADVFEAVLNQQPGRFPSSFAHDPETGPVTSEAVAIAWETAMHALGVDADERLFADPCPDTTATIERITANREFGSGRWAEGLRAGAFAATLAPSWALEHIRTTAPATAGAWDLLPVPGTVGNQGGMSLAVSADSEHAELAMNLISHLTRASSQSTAFREFGNLPASADQYESAAVLDHREPFFGDAAIGSRYVDSVSGYEPAARDEHDHVIVREFREAVSRVDAGTQTPDEAWSEAMWRIDLFLRG